MVDPSKLKIGVVGAGQMGHGIAQVFACAGSGVVMVDVDMERLKKALRLIEENLAFLAEKGLFRGRREEVLRRIEPSTALDPLKEADLVVESVYEDLKLKQDLFFELDRLCRPQTALASNTSVISITEIAQRCRRKERVLGTHFWNPPFLVPLVEVVKTEHTSEEVFDFAYEVLLAVGKRPIKCLRDVPGFIANRLQHALWREAVSLVEKGIADPETVDEAIKLSFGLRLPVLGPLENADMVGLDLVLSIHDYIFKYLDASKEASPLLREKVEKGELGFKSQKGFYTWTEQKAKQKREELLEHLVRWHLSQKGQGGEDGKAHN